MKYILFLIIVVTILQGCNVINPSEPTPAFLHIDSVQVVATNTNQHGSISNNITDVWAYHNNDLLGAFHLPADIPIIPSDLNALDIRAGIMTNGVQATREAYPFYKVYSSKVDWQAGTRKTITPVFSYVDNAKFHWIEDFEFGASMLNAGGDTNWNKYSGPNVFEGISCGYAYVDTAHKIARSEFQVGLNLPSGRPYYIEMNYKCDVPIKIFVSSTINGNKQEIFLAGVNPKPEWNKIYFNLGALIDYMNSNSEYLFTIESGLLDGQLKGEAYFDNFKIIGFQ
jgi:hypothetical protein